MLYFLVFLAGMAALSWEAIWQIKSSLALGASAWGTALTLSVTMGGMCLGALFMGQALRGKDVTHPLRLYGIVEIIIGLAGLLLPYAFDYIEQIDTKVFRMMPDIAFGVHISGIILALGIPTMCMGATLPVLGLIARQCGCSIAVLYSLNTLGAAIGVLGAAFVIIPIFEITSSIYIIATINLVIGTIAILFSPKIQNERNNVSKKKLARNTYTKTSEPIPLPAAVLIAFTTGFVIFILEVAWFRSLTAAFMSTTEAFAIMLSSVLIALGIGSSLAPHLKRNGMNLGLILCSAGIAVFLITPIVERFDLFMRVHADIPILLFIQWFSVTLYIIGLPIILIGVGLPWVLDDQKTPALWGRIYGLNALAAVIGAVTATWFLLPSIGFARTAWVAGGVLILSSFWMVPRKKKAFIGALAICSVAFTLFFESGVGRDRIQGTSRYTSHTPTILGIYEGPDATLSAVEYNAGHRILFIDGFIATMQSGGKANAENIENYMDWMGHLPMLLHPDPENALVICFGTGQTANAVRKEEPVKLDLVDISRGAFALAQYFPLNENVLDDPRVTPVIMDGRAFIRRTETIYDIITLEPMPPTFSGVNALYSLQFYQKAKEKLSEQGVIAQWLPFHLVSPEYGSAIALTFQKVFPNAVLWIHEASGTGILLGSKDSRDLINNTPLNFNRTSIVRPLNEKQIMDGFALNSQQLARYAKSGKIITDDNQLLSYGKASRIFHGKDDKNSANQAALEQAKRPDQ